MGLCVSKSPAEDLEESMAKDTQEEKRVLTVQSTVVVGYAGNKAATFPLQLLGWEVEALHTVQFSNHTGYKRFGGSRFDAAHLEDIFQAMETNGLLRQSHFLTGYVPGPEALKVVAKMAKRLREANPDLVYVLDPVMGDDGRIYVSPEVIPIYKSLLPLATITTPNYFEAELLTEVKLTSLSAIREALHKFHGLYSTPNVIISSVSLPQSELKILDPSIDDNGTYLVCAGSSVQKNGDEKAFALLFPAFEEHFEGVGDLFSALITARFSPTSSSHPISPLAQAAELAIGSLHGVLVRTRAKAAEIAERDGIVLKASEEEGPEDRVRRLRTVELRLVQSQEELKNPKDIYEAVKL
ncbi:Bud site selection protein 16, partial [Atractiella rhizophila]